MNDSVFFCILMISSFIIFKYSQYTKSVIEHLLHII